jgi:pantoate--beta-alanine ligase
MEVVQESASLRRHVDERRRSGKRISFVPTMGALHDGHRSLMARARESSDYVVASIFVNPLQFNNPNDLATYPKDEEGDLLTCRDMGVDLVFVPSVETIYPTWPNPPVVTVSVGESAEVLEGRSRPGHFNGMATVVAKLFNIVGECTAFFGEKDFQQLFIVRQMVRDLSLSTLVQGVPTVREKDGLALSSRNVRLSESAREAARGLSAALGEAVRLWHEGSRDPEAINAAMADTLSRYPAVSVDYAVTVNAETLKAPLMGHSFTPRFLVAGVVDGVRLIDNCGAQGLGL